MKMAKSDNQKMPYFKVDIQHFVVIFFILLVLWFLLSGHFEVKMVLYAVVTCALSARLGVHLLKAPIREDGRKITLGGGRLHFFRLIGYLAWLIKEIVKANIHIALIVLSPKLPIDPSIVTFRLRFDNPLAVFALANSITLTPGTITLDVEDDVYIIHCLTRAAANGVTDQNGGMPNDMACRVAKLFGETIPCKEPPGEECS